MSPRRRRRRRYVGLVEDVALVASAIDGGPELERAIAEREAALELLTPEARARLEAAETELERQVLFGASERPEGRSDG